MLAILLIAIILLLLNRGRTVGVGSIVSQVFKIIVAIIVIKLLLVLLASVLTITLFGPFMSHLSQW